MRRKTKVVKLAVGSTLIFIVPLIVFPLVAWENQNNQASTQATLAVFNISLTSPGGPTTPYADSTSSIPSTYTTSNLATSTTEIATTSTEITSTQQTTTATTEQTTTATQQTTTATQQTTTATEQTTTATQQTTAATTEQTTTTATTTEQTTATSTQTITGGCTVTDISDQFTFYSSYTGSTSPPYVFTKLFQKAAFTLVVTSGSSLYITELRFTMQGVQSLTVDDRINTPVPAPYTSDMDNYLQQPVTTSEIGVDMTATQGATSISVSAFVVKGCP